MRRSKFLFCGFVINGFLCVIVYSIYLYFIHSAKKLVENNDCVQKIIKVVEAEQICNCHESRNGSKEILLWTPYKGKKIRLIRITWE